jgi:hypothetical protein
MSTLTLPEEDLSLSVTAGQATAPSQRLQVVRPWREGVCEHRVRYRADGHSLFAELDDSIVALDRPMCLEPVTVDKPWGTETWYSGIEARGESSVAVPDGSVPLFTYLSLAPQRLCGGRLPVLLKILKSRPEPLLGELYFEIHQNKQEVYVVANVDPAAHPDGNGTVRFGVNQSLRADYDDDAAFRKAFLNAVNEYEQLAARSHDKPGNGPAGGRSSDPDLQEARAHVLSFTATRSLSRGDTLTVPVGVPHSLQAGLTVLEFQTPSYERQIIFASQPVRTQAGWDSASAIAGMSLDTPEGPRGAAETKELIARFPEFSLWRWHLQHGSARALPDNLSHAICTVFEGEVAIASSHDRLVLAQSQAAFIPGSAQAVSFATSSAATLLIAVPNR